VNAILDCAVDKEAVDWFYSYSAHKDCIGKHSVLIDTSLVTVAVESDLCRLNAVLSCEVPKDLRGSPYHVPNHTIIPFLQLKLMLMPAGLRYSDTPICWSVYVCYIWDSKIWFVLKEWWWWYAFNSSLPLGTADRCSARWWGCYRWRRGLMDTAGCSIVSEISK